jgi:hypothetical protein
MFSYSVRIQVATNACTQISVNTKGKEKKRKLYATTYPAYALELRNFEYLKSVLCEAENNYELSGLQPRLLLDHLANLLQELRFDLLQTQAFCLRNIEDHKHKGQQRYSPKQEENICWPQEFL